MFLWRKRKNSVNNNSNSCFVEGDMVVRVNGQNEHFNGKMNPMASIVGKKYLWCKDKKCIYNNWNSYIVERDKAVRVNK